MKTVVSNLLGADAEQKIDAIFTDYTVPGSPGAAVGIYKSGEIVFAKGYGLADIEAGTPVTPKTPFHVASISKQFTCFAIALLAREGALDLNAEVKRYLPYFPEFGHTVTVQHLVHNTSGLRDQWALFCLAGKDMRDVLRQEHVVNMVTRQKTLNFEPGSRYLYSNTGFTLLAEIVHAVSGKTLRQFTTERIFKPLGMADTFFFDDVSEIVLGRSNSYDRDPDGKWQRSLLNYQTVGATSLFTTIEDLAKWAGNFSDPRIGDSALIQQITRSGTLNDGTATHYCFGLLDTMQDGRRAIHHSGGDAAYRMLFVFYPDYDAAVAVLTNCAANSEELLHAVANIYLPPGDQEASTASESLSADPALLGELAGTYMCSTEQSVMIHMRDSKAYLTVGSEEKEIIFLKDDRIKAGYASYQPVMNRDGSIIALDIVQENGGSQTRLDRVTPARSTIEELRTYTGTYHSDELEISYSIELRDGQLFANHIWRPAPLALRQVVGDQFDADDSWRLNAVTFKRAVEGHVSGLCLHVGRAHNIYLSKLD